MRLGLFAGESRVGGIVFRVQWRNLFLGRIRLGEGRSRSVFLSDNFGRGRSMQLRSLRGLDQLGAGRRRLDVGGDSEGLGDGSAAVDDGVVEGLGHAGRAGLMDSTWVHFGREDRQRVALQGASSRLIGCR